MVDFEDFPVKAQPAFLTLLTELSQDLHAKGQKLYVSVPARSSDYNYRAIADASDGVVLMDYDEHYTGQGGSAGPIASQDWFTKNLEEAKKSIPLEKLICGIANYGYEWVQQPKRGKLPPGVPEHGIAVSVQDAWLDARDSEEDVDFDGDSMNPHISYMD